MNCTLYSNTGFNTINIPDSPTLANQNAQINTTTIDCLQNRFLSNISVKTTWEDIQNVDYVNVDGFYYFVNGITMTSYDVARLDLSPDFITSAGGPLALKILDGITERHHVLKSDDSFGKYDETDPLLSPAQPLELMFGDGLFVTGEALTSLDYYTLAESSIDLSSMGTETALQGETYTDGENSVTVPHTIPSTRTTEFSLEDGLSTKTVGTCLYDTSNAQVQTGMQRARDLGVENAVIAQYALPKNMFNVTIQDGIVTEIKSLKVSGSTVGLPYQYTSVRNQRVLSGDFNRYGILCASGNSYEANPEQIYYTGTTQPTIIYRGDGRNDGKPYFNFEFYLGQSNNNIKTFFKNAIGGMEWRNVPLTYVTPAHSIQDSYNFRSQLSRSESSNYYTHENYELGQKSTRLSALASAAGSLGSTIEAFGQGDISGGFSAAVSGAVGVLNASNSMAMAQNSELNRQATYRLERQNELYNFQVSQNVVEPTIKFPFQTPSIRDYYGNGCLSYRYRYSDSDITRIDKILTAYGYHITEMLTPEMFNNRPQFNFVKASGISIGNNLPTWWKNGIAQQFGAGVRIWHVKPDPVYYTQNE